jgi:lipoprotein NlpD
MPSIRQSSGLLSILLAALMLAGCASKPTKAPVEDRKPSKAAAPASAPVAPAASAPEAAKPLPGAENAGRAGYYTVKPGDTMIRIGLENGQNWRDIVRWNGIENPNLIEVGQVLRIVAPGVDPSAVAARGVAPPQVEARPLDAKSAAASAQPASAASAASAAPATAAARDGDEEPAWAWPAGGTVVAGFDEARNKGLDIGGKAGDPVLVAADGRVMWAGYHRGYGNLVIVKHNNTYLTAYGNNQTLLVKEDQVVRRGQKIAEMGASDAERVQLHFEIRRQGKPVDPARLLPAR